ncbi:serine/threonine protein kinase [candidate division WOR-3 bacterium]|nr:serine/threonine protein kinase [candidate division WOR-3 bacterium]
MSRCVNVWNEWDPLKRTILGRVECSSVPAPDPEWWHDCPQGGITHGSQGRFPEDQIAAAKQQQDEFVAILEKRGVIVDRPDVHPALCDGRATSTPDWTQLGQYPAVPCRDLYLTVGNELIEAPGSRRSRWYEYLNYRPVFERYFKEDPDFHWVSAPKPRLTDESFVKNYYYDFHNKWSDEQKQQHVLDWNYRLTEKEPVWDAADCIRFGKDIFVQASVLTNRSGMDWLKRHFAARGIRVHAVQFKNDMDPWHIDVNLVPLRPGLCTYNPAKPPIQDEVFQLFKMNDWELVPAAEPQHVFKAPVRVFTEWGQKSWISMNTLSLGPNTVCVEENETAQQELLDKLGIEVVPVPYADVIPFGGSLHCTTQDVYREGTLEDYFPKQIPGF